MTGNTDVKTAEVLTMSGQDDLALRSARALVLQHTRQREDGTTVTEVAQATNIPRHRVRALLSELEQEREIYSRRIIGSNAIIYYPNGKLIHKYLQRSKEFGSQIFRISFHEGRTAPRVQIQERRFSLLDGERIEGSVFVDFNNLDGFMDFLNQMKKDFQNFER